MGGRSSAHPSRPQISDPVRLDRGLGLLLPLWAVVQNRVPGWRAEVRLNGILPRAFAEAMLPKAQAPSRVGLGQPLLLGKFGRRRHRLGLLAPAPKQNLMETALLAECNVERSNFRARAADSNRLGLFGAQTRDPRFREDVSLDHARLQINIDTPVARRRARRRASFNFSGFVMV
jgi:hypothetical protein